MALVKRTYTDGETIITAQNLNDIQDEIISLGNNSVPKARRVNTKELSGDITINASDIPNDSTVSGSKVDDALETLHDEIGDLNKPFATTVIDFDTEDSLAIYFNMSSSTGTKPPFTGNGYLFNVLRSSNNVTQFAVDNAGTGNVWMRQKISGTWNDWEATNTLPESIAIVENGSTASGSITKGRFVLWNNVLYTAKSNISSGDTLSTSNLDAVSNGGLNKLRTDLDTVVEQLDGLYVNNNTAYETVAAVATYVSGKSTGDIVLVRVTSGIASSFFETTTSYASVLIIMKASSSNAYYLAFNRNVAAVGNISLTNSSVSAVHDL